MTAAELRSRIARSGVSGKRLAGLLGIPQPNVSNWCSGIRPIPTHHVPAIIRLTDNPPRRTGPAWRPPPDMPAGRSQGWHSKVSRQRRAARAERPAVVAQQPARLPRSDRQPVQSDRPAKATAIKPAIDRPQPAAPSLDLSALADLVKPAGLSIGSGSGTNGTAHQTPLASLHRAASVTPAVRPVGSVAPRQRAAQTRQPGTPQPPAGALGTPGRAPIGAGSNGNPMAGPLHADFVRQHNREPQPLDADAIMLMRFARGRR